MSAVIPEPLTDQRRAEIVRMLRRQGRTEAEALRAIGRWLENAPLEMESVTCWECDGWGQSIRPGCIGRQSRECATCHGQGKATRFKLPQGDAT